MSDARMLDRRRRDAVTHALHVGLGGRRYVPRHCSLEFDVMYHGVGGAGHGGCGKRPVFTNKNFTSETYTIQLNNKLSANNNQTIG